MVLMLAEYLFVFKKDQTTYGVNSTSHNLPMYLHSGATCKTVNNFLVYMLTELENWQSMAPFGKLYVYYGQEEVEPAKEHWPPVEGQTKAHDIPGRPLITGNLIAYLAAMCTQASGLPLQNGRCSASGVSVFGLRAHQGFLFKNWRGAASEEFEERSHPVVPAISFRSRWSGCW